MTDGKVITIFGGSTPVDGDSPFEAAETLGRKLAEAGFTVATGGYIGTMEAVSRGASEAGGRAIGVTSDQIEQWRAIAPNSWLTEEIREERLIDRVSRLIEIGDALIALPGGIGTLTEISFAWSQVQIHALKEKPLILVGRMWGQVFAPFIEPGNPYVRPANFQLLRFVEDAQEAFEEVMRYFHD